MNALFLFFVLISSSLTAPADPPLVGGFRPVPPSRGGPIGVSPVPPPSSQDRASLPIWDGGNNVKPWLSSQPRIPPQ